MGFCEYQLGNVKNAIETFQSFKNQFKDSPLLLYTHYLLGKIFMMNGDHLSSIKELNLILNSSQGNIWGGASLLTLYWNYLQLGDPEGVNRTFQRVQKLNQFEDEKIFIQWLNAEIYFAEGKYRIPFPIISISSIQNLEKKPSFKSERDIFSKINLEKRLPI